MNSQLEKVLSDSRADNIKSATLADLREVRNALQQAETDVSLVRRLTQGRLDIVGNEVSNRAGSESELDTSALLFDLPEILADGSNSGGGRGRAEVSAPGEVAHSLTTELDGLVSPSALSALSGLNDDELNSTLGSLTDFENGLSGSRKELHTKIDAIQLEIGRRYKDGEATTADAFGAK